jgi:O-antigen/teichoic acid export membrane protein
MLNFKSKILRDSIFYTILPRISFLTYFLLLPIISPYLTLIDFGIYGIIMAYVGAIQMFTGLGQIVLLQNSFFSFGSKYKLIWKRSLALMIITGILASIFTSFFLYIFFRNQLGDNLYPVIISLSVYFIFTPIESIILNYYTLNENAFPYAIKMGIIGVINSLLTLFTIKYLGLGYLGWVISLPVSATLMNILFFKKIYIDEQLYPNFVLKKRFLKNAFNIGIPLIPHQLSLFILGVSDRLLLGFFNVPIRQIGFYSQGYSFGSQGLILVNGVFQAYSRKIQDGFRGNSIKNKIFIKKAIVLIPLCLSFIFFLCCIWIKQLFFFLFINHELRESYPIALVVLGSNMFWGINSFFTYPLAISNQTLAISKITMLAASFNLLGNIIFIPIYGIWASAFITFVSYVIFGFAGILNKSNRQFLMKYIDLSRFSVIMFSLNILFLIFSYFVIDAEIPTKIMLTLGFIFIFLIVVKKIK